MEDLEITIKVSETEYRAEEELYKKHGLANKLPGWRPPAHLSVVKKIVEAIRGKK